MALYVYVTDECRIDAHRLRHEPRLDAVKLQVEKAQNLSGFSNLSSAVLKKKIGRQFRLIVSQRAVENDEIVIFLRFLRRRDTDYPQILDEIKRNPRPYREDDLKKEYKRMTTEAPLPPKPTPNNEENAWLYEVLQENTLTNDTFIFETRLWVDEMRGNQFASLYHQLLGDLADTTRLKVAERCDHWRGDLGISYYYRRDFNSILLLSPLHRESTTPKLDEYTKRLSNVSDRDDLSRLAARSYPHLVVIDIRLWLAIQNDEESNLALSPEESQIINSLRGSGTESNIAYPLFINGLAGSGKSTILQYLASAYVDFALRRPTDRLPLYLTASDDLLSRARQIVKGLLTTNHERILEDKIDQKVIDGLLGQSFQTFHRLLYSLLSSDLKNSLRSNRHVNYASFRRLWHRDFAKQQRASRLSVEVSWHVIRSLIKGIRSDSDDELAPEDYEELPRRRQSVSLEDYQEVYSLVWDRWYKPLCNAEGYWDDQDLAAYVLSEGAASREDRAAIFCDEAQDFTSVELDVIFQLSLYGRRTLEPYALKRVPIIFAGDPLQTINPTGFRWDAVKADFHDRFRATLEARSKLSIDMTCRDLRFNYRSNAGIVRFCNLIQLVRAALLDHADIRPQEYYWQERSVPPTWFDLDNPATEQHLREHPEFVKLVYCHEGEETDYVKGDTLLRNTLDHSEGTYRNVMCPTRAKGLEFSAVVLYRFGDHLEGFDRVKVDLDNPRIRLRWEYFFSRLYVAASRARDRLIVVDSEDGMKRLWQFATDPQFYESLLEATSRPADWRRSSAQLSPQPIPAAWEVGQHIDQQAQAERYAAEGTRDGDPYLLRQAGMSFQIANAPNQAEKCFAQATEMEEKWKVAGDRYCKLHLHEDAFRCYWKGKLWVALKDLALRVNYVGRLESRAADFMASGESPPTSFLIQLSSAVENETRLREIATDQVWHSVIVYTASRVVRSLDSTGVSWIDLLTTFERLTREGVGVSKSSLATFAYRSREYRRAVELWEEDNQTVGIEYKRARAYISPFPDCIEPLKQIGDHAEIIRLWKENRPSDSVIRTLNSPIIYAVTTAALDGSQIEMAASIIQIQPHRELVGKLIAAAVHAKNETVIYTGVVVATRLFVQTGAWNDVVDAENLSSIGKLSGVPKAAVRAALDRLDRSSVVLETIVGELAKSKALTDSAPRVVAAFLYRIFIGDNRRRDLGIPPHVVGAAIERSGKIVDALQYYKNLLQQDRDDIRRFAAERLVRNHERYAHYFETTRHIQQAQNQHNLAKQIRKEWGIGDSDLDEFPSVEAPATDFDGTLSPQRDKRGRAALQRSLRNPHPETRLFAEMGEAEWFAGLPDGDEDLVDPEAGQAVRWIPGEGWVEE